MLAFACRKSPAVKDNLTISGYNSVSPSTAPSPRPGLSRTNSVNYSVETDDGITGLTLLDALVVLDSHLDLARRQISRKGQEWKSRAESTAISVKRQAEEVLNQRRLKRRVTSGGQRTRSSADVKSTADGEQSEEDRIDLDRELAKFRQNVRYPADALNRQTDKSVSVDTSKSNSRSHEMEG